MTRTIEHETKEATRHTAKTIAADLREAIERGDYQAGDRLPSMLDLSETYGVDIGTAGRALRKIGPEELGAGALAMAESRVGWFVL